MAFTLAEAVVFFKGDDSKLSSDLDNAEGKTKGFASTATNLIGGAVVGASLAAGAAIIGIGTAAFNVSQDTATAAADIAASLGIPAAEAERFAEVARRVYGNKFADSVGDAGVAVAELAKKLQLTADDPSLQRMTENAFRLRDSFGVDVADSINAVKTLTEQFGITNDEAFDLVAAGYQRGLDSSGDFLDSIGEYSNQFAAGGATASQFFSVMDQGLVAGVLGTDKAADAFKEFAIRIQDGSTLTSESLTMLGLDADKILAGLSDGSLTVVDVWDQVQGALNETQDPLVQMQAGVGLLGTQFEDLTAGIATNLSTTNDWANTSAGAIDSLDAKYATFGSAVDRIWRRLVVSISPFTDKLLELVNSAMPSVMGAFDAFDANVVPIMNNIGTVISNVVNFIVPLFSQLGTSVDNASGPLRYWADWVNINMPMIQDLFQRVLGGIQDFWRLFGDDILRIVNNTFSTISLTIDTVMRTIGDVITLALQLLTGDWEGAWETFKGIFERIWDTIKQVVSNQLDSLRTIFSNIDWGAVGEALINAVLTGIKAAWTGLTTWFTQSLQTLWNSITGTDWTTAGKTIVNNTHAGAVSVWGTFSSWYKTSVEGLYTYWNNTTWEQKGKDAINAVKIGSETGWAIYKGSLATLIDQLLGLFTGKDWSGTGNTIISNIGTGVNLAWNAFVADFGQRIYELQTMFYSLNLGEAGKAIVDAIKTGIEEKWGELSGWFRGKLQGLVDMLPFSEPKDSSSPMRNLAKSGRSFVGNWRDGMEDELGNLKTNLSAGLGGLVDGLNGRASGSQAAGAAGNMNINVYLSGNDATYENGQKVGRGVRDELRKRGA